MIGKGEGWHLQLNGPVNKIANFAGTVKKAVFTVDVEVDKIVFAHKSFSSVKNYDVSFLIVLL